MAEIETIQVECKTEPENNSDEVIHNTLEEASVLEEDEEEMTVKQENLEWDAEDFYVCTENTQQSPIKGNAFKLLIPSV